MELETTNLNIEVIFTAFDKERNYVFVKKFSSDGKPQFRVRIYLEGPDLDKVQKVVYQLHPTFSSPRRTIKLPPNFELKIWTWGIFKLPVEIYDKEGRIDRRVIDFDYTTDIRKAQKNNLLYWEK